MPIVKSIVMPLAHIVRWIKRWRIQHDLDAVNHGLQIIDKERHDGLIAEMFLRSERARLLSLLRRL